MNRSVFFAALFGAILLLIALLPSTTPNQQGATVQQQQQQRQFLQQIPVQNTDDNKKDGDSNDQDQPPKSSASSSQNHHKNNQQRVSLHDLYYYPGQQGRHDIPPEDADVVDDPEALRRLGKGPHIDERPNSTTMIKIARHIWPHRRWTQDQPKPASTWIDPAKIGPRDKTGGRNEHWYEPFDPEKHAEFTRPLYFSGDEWKAFTKFRVVINRYTRGSPEWGKHVLDYITDHPNEMLPPWRPGRARPIICDRRQYYSAYFSIPEQNIFNRSLGRAVMGSTGGRSVRTGRYTKTKDWSTVLPGRKSTYVFKREDDFREDMEKSFFSLTRRKYGWVTSRNMEILAAGSVPYFCGIEAMPQVGTLRHLPIDALFAIRLAMPGLVVKCQPPKLASVGAIKRPPFENGKYYIVANKLLEYTRTSLTTDLHARYLLSATSLTQLPKKVLLVWSIPYSILLTGLIHGLRTLGVDVIDVPRRPETYAGDSCEENKSKTYAKGWFFFCKTPESPGISRKNIGRRIAEKEFDVIIFGISDYWTYHMIDPFEEVPYFSHAVKYYSRDRLVTVNDADLIKPMTADVAARLMWNYTLYFKRETHTCGGFA